MHTLRNYSYNGMNPLVSLVPISFWHLVARLDVDVSLKMNVIGLPRSNFFLSVPLPAELI